MKMHRKGEIFLPTLLSYKLHCQIVWCGWMWFQESKHIFRFCSGLNFSGLSLAAAQVA